MPTFVATSSGTEQEWEGMTDLPSYIPFADTPGFPFKSSHTQRGTFATSQDDEIELLERLFEKCPAKRLTARMALQHSYFSNAPPPTPHDQLNLGKGNGGAAGAGSGGGSSGDQVAGGAGAGAGAGVPADNTSSLKRKYNDADDGDNGDGGTKGALPTKLAF